MSDDSDWQRVQILEEHSGTAGCPICCPPFRTCVLVAIHLPEVMQERVIEQQEGESPQGGMIGVNGGAQQLRDMFTEIGAEHLAHSYDRGVITYCTCPRCKVPALPRSQMRCECGQDINAHSQNLHDSWRRSWR